MSGLCVERVKTIVLYRITKLRFPEKLNRAPYYIDPGLSRDGHVPFGSVSLIKLIESFAL